MIETADPSISDPIYKSYDLHNELFPYLEKASDYWKDTNFSSAAQIYEPLFDMLLKEAHSPEGTVIDPDDLKEQLGTLAELCVLSRVWSTKNYENALSAAQYIYNCDNALYGMVTPKLEKLNTTCAQYDYLLFNKQYEAAARLASVMIIMSTQETIPYSLILWEESFVKAQSLSFQQNPRKYRGQEHVLVSYAYDMYQKYKKHPLHPLILNTIDSLYKATSISKFPLK